MLSLIPKGARVCFTLWGRKGTEDVALGWVNLQLIDYKHELRTGLVSLSLWPNEQANPIGTCIANGSPNAPMLYIEFDTYSLPVVYPTEPLKEYTDNTPTHRSMTISVKASKMLGVNENVNTIDKIAATG